MMYSEPDPPTGEPISHDSFWTQPAPAKKHGRLEDCSLNSAADNISSEDDEEFQCRTKPQTFLKLTTFHGDELVQSTG